MALKIKEIKTATVVGNYYWTYVRIYAGDEYGTGEGFFAPGLEEIVREMGRLLDTTPGSGWAYDLEDLTFTIGLVQRLSNALLDELAHFPQDLSLPWYMVESHRFIDAPLDPVKVCQASRALRCVLDTLDPLINPSNEQPSG